MIKKTIYITITLFSAVLLWNCEKDDICNGTPTTPQLIIEFYDVTNPSAKKTIASLEIVEENRTDTLLFQGKNAIKLPLRTNAEKTSFLLTFNFLNPNGVILNSDIDKLEFNYTTEDFYVSRACGYKTLFTLNSSNGVIDTSYDNTSWIQDIQVLQTNIINENETHIKIFL